MIDSNLLLMAELGALVVLVLAGAWSIFNNRKPAAIVGPAPVVHDMRHDGQTLIVQADTR